MFDGGPLCTLNAFNSPVPHTRYITADSGYEKDGSAKLTSSSNWIRKPAASTSASSASSDSFTLMATDTVGVLDDDKIGGVTTGGNFCLDLVYDTDAEVWAGPLASNKLAVALLNRDPTGKFLNTLTNTPESDCVGERERERERKRDLFALCNVPEE